MEKCLKRISVSPSEDLTPRHQMDLKFAVLLISISLVISQSEARPKRKIIIHLPSPKAAPKKSPSVHKEVHHHYKPSIIKEEKIIKQEIHKVPKHEEFEHEHIHHHYKHEHTDSRHF